MRILKLQIQNFPVYTIVLWTFESVSFLNWQFYPRTIKSIFCWIDFTLLPIVEIYITDVNRNFTIEMKNSRNVSWRFKFHGLCHLIVKLRFNIIETNLYDWKVLNFCTEKNIFQKLPNYLETNDKILKRRTFF